MKFGEWKNILSNRSKQGKKGNKQKKLGKMEAYKETSDVFLIFKVKTNLSPKSIKGKNIWNHENYG